MPGLRSGLDAERHAVPISILPPSPYFDSLEWPAMPRLNTRACERGACGLHRAPKPHADGPAPRRGRRIPVRAFCAADAMFAQVVTRLNSYGVDLDRCMRRLQLCPAEPAGIFGRADATRMGANAVRRGPRPAGRGRSVHRLCVPECSRRKPGIMPLPGTPSFGTPAPLLRPRSNIKD